MLSDPALNKGIGPSADSTTRTALVLLAHQDDEFAVQPMLLQARQAGLQVHAAFLTKAAQAALDERRNTESLQVLQALGVPEEQVHWAGQALQIIDGELVQHLQDCTLWLQNLMQGLRPEEIWVPAWEGGHPDHDGLHACAVLTAQRLDLLPKMRQFSLYNGWRCPAPWFRVLTPLPDNGPALAHPLSTRLSWRCLHHCLAYPSQWRSWVGLLPAVAWQLLWRGCLYSQPVQVRRLRERPHAGRLYYESRGFSQWEDLQDAVLRLLADGVEPQYGC